MHPTVPGMTFVYSHENTVCMDFKDHLGGLEVKDVDGKWISAQPNPGTVFEGILQDD